MILKGEQEINKFIEENGISHFRAEEFKCPCCGEVMIDSQLLLKLNDLRHYYGQPIKITSGYRCPNHNLAVGGVPNSAHTKGKAVDIKVEDSRDRFKIIAINFAMNIGFRRIGIAHTFIHLDIDETKPQDVIWVYPIKHKS